MPKYTDTNNLIPLPLMHQILWPLANWTNGSHWALCLRGFSLELSTLGFSSTYNNTLQILQRIAMIIFVMGAAPPKAGPGACK